MFKIDYATEKDTDIWLSLDPEISKNELILKFRDHRAYLINNDDCLIGIMRYNLMWDIIPFLTLIYIENHSQGKGFGRQAMNCWEQEMKELGYQVVMTSTQVNEQAQHFYRKLGYVDRGSLFLDNTVLEQPQEMFMIKSL